MPYQLERGKMHRMPTHFGPRMGPKQGEASRRFENKDTPKKTTVAVSFLTDADQFEALLPERLQLSGRPVVIVAATYIAEIEWLAGRGYNVLGVSFPAAFERQGEHETTNDFQRVHRSPAFTPGSIARLYGLAPDAIAIHPSERRLAVKISLPRQVSSGAPGDVDVYGSQQHMGLGEIEID